MIHRKWSGALSALAGVIIFATPSPSATVSAAETEHSGWANILQISTNVRQKITPVQQLDLYLPALVEERDRRFNVAVNELRQQRTNLTPADTRSQKERRSVRADMPVSPPEPLPPTLPAPRSDLPAPVDPEPEPHANVPAQELPPAVQPAPVQPGLPSPPMPQPAEPGLAPPPMPQPAEPPPLSTRPDLNLPAPAVPEQEPAPPSPVPEPEPTAY